MNAICKSVWSIVLLGLVVGCGGEPETAPPAPADGGAKANYPPAGKAGAGVKASSRLRSGCQAGGNEERRRAAGSRRAQGRKHEARSHETHRPKSSPRSRNYPPPNRPRPSHKPSAR